MITKELTCYECSYCGRKYNKEEDCAACESRHLDSFNTENSKFTTFRADLSNVYSRVNTRPSTVSTVTKEVEEEYDTGEKDENGNAIMATRTVEKEVEEITYGDVPILHCSRCSKLINENETFLRFFGHILCVECSTPILKYFNKIYTAFTAYFTNFIGDSTPHISRFELRPHDMRPDAMYNPITEMYVGGDKPSTSSCGCDSDSSSSCKHYH